MEKAQIGILGLGVMGQSLALNMLNHGYRVAVFNRRSEVVDEFISERAQGKQVIGCHTLEELVDSLEKPRKIMLMIKAGSPVDDMVERLKPLLEAGDLIIDGGNSFYKDTIRRAEGLRSSGILYMGAGVSGGEEGALKGPSIMPGGPKEAWDLVGEILQTISAKVDGEPCCTYLGPDGVGHYVKTVHNGIEYGDMQLIAEAYYLMRELLGMEAPEIAKVFEAWNATELESYLIEITADILDRIDPETGKPLVDVILDSAGQKGTGKWTAQEALEIGTPTPTIAEAVFARTMSAIKAERVAASKELPGPQKKFAGDKEEVIEAIRQALYASKICAYAQGFALMQATSRENNWNLNLGDIALIWRGGCIIRAQFLNRIKEAYDRNPELPNLLLDPYFKDAVIKAQDAWRKVVCLATEYGIPVPGFASALSYYDSYRREFLPANLIQAQRDYFGAHTYERIDKEGFFHTEWV